MQNFRMARAVLSIVNIGGAVLILAGLYLLFTVLPRGGAIAGLLPGLIVLAIGMVVMAVAQLGLAQITTAENTGEMLRLMAQGNSIAGAGEAPEQDLLDVYRGKRILRGGDGVSVDGLYYPNVGIAKTVIDKEWVKG